MFCFSFFFPHSPFLFHNQNMRSCLPMKSTMKVFTSLTKWPTTSADGDADP